MYAEMNAWREILARIFEGFQDQDNVSPAWLVNPTTKRRLKLDKFYPEAGIAIRFVGLMAKGQGRQSDVEVMETEQRDQTRIELCRRNGVQLVLVDPADDCLKQLDNLNHCLSRASHTLAQSSQSLQHKQRWMPALNEARSRVAQLRALLAKNPAQMMDNLAASWRDRETGGLPALDEIPTPAPVSKRATQNAAQHFAAGQRVCHERFGEGVITNISDDREKISILFDAAQERTFLLALVEDKLTLLALQV